MLLISSGHMNFMLLHSIIFFTGQLVYNPQPPWDYNLCLNCCSWLLVFCPNLPIFILHPYMVWGRITSDCLVLLWSLSLLYAVKMQCKFFFFFEESNSATAMRHGHFQKKRKKRSLVRVSMSDMSITHFRHDLTLKITYFTFCHVVMSTLCPNLCQCLYFL